MQMPRAVKLLKRVWKAVFWIDLVVATALVLFLSQFFSYDVFTSNLHRAAAATSSQPR